MDSIEFQTLFADKLKERGFTLRKLSELSGISAKHIESLAAGRFELLPPAPYLRGYLLKLGTILDFNGEAWWEHLKEEGLIKGSGPTDALPKNRFAKEPMGKKIIIGTIVILLVVYFGFRFSKILGKPMLTISYPAEDLITVHDDRIIIQGEVSGSDELKVNGEPVAIDAIGRWEKNILLQPGRNPVSIIAKKFLGRQTEVSREIIYQTPPKTGATSTAPTSAPLSE
ncbi:MAG: helix-turn-helix domain-containing protein [Patescibacteria group bacterium]